MVKLNSDLLLETMRENNDNIRTLSNKLNISRQTLSLKIDGISDFKLNEIIMIIKTYALSEMQVREIFFNECG